MAGSSSCGVWCVEWMGGWMESGNKYNHSVGHLSRPVLVLVSVLVFVSVVIVSVVIASVGVSVVECSDHGLHGVHWVKFGFVQLVGPLTGVGTVSPGCKAAENERKFTEWRRLRRVSGSICMPCASTTGTIRWKFPRTSASPLHVPRVQILRPPGMSEQPF